MTRRRFVGGVMLGVLGPALSRAAPASGWQIGCYTRPWAEHDYRVALDGIAAAGFQYAGLMTAKGGVIVRHDTPPDQIQRIAAEVKARNLRVPSIWGGDFLIKNSLPESVAALKRLVDHTAICGSPGLLLGGTSRAELVDNYYRVVAECGEYARSKNVRFSVKPHGGTNATGAQCRKLIEKVGRANLGVWYDPGNIFYYSDGKMDPVNDAPSVDGLVVGMSVKDFRPPKEVSLTPGTGKVDFAKVIAQLRRGGFTRGPLVVECLTPGDLAHLTAEARKAREFVEMLMT